MYNTFNGWKKLGRVVAAGETGRYENEYGDKMFHRYQTVLKGNTVTRYYDNRGRVIRKIVEYI